MDLNLWHEPDAKGKECLNGRITLTAVSGNLPATVDLYHFQVFGGVVGGLANYSRGRDGKWRHATARVPEQHPEVTVTKSPTNIIMDFKLNYGTSATNGSVAVSLADAQRERHILSKSAMIERTQNPSR